MEANFERKSLHYNAFGIAPERRDVLLDPFEGKDLWTSPGLESAVNKDKTVQGTHGLEAQDSLSLRRRLPSPPRNRMLNSKQNDLSFGEKFTEVDTKATHHLCDNSGLR